MRQQAGRVVSGISWCSRPISESSRKAWAPQRLSFSFRMFRSVSVCRRAGCPCEYTGEYEHACLPANVGLRGYLGERVCAVLAHTVCVSRMHVGVNVDASGRTSCIFVHF